MAKICPRRYPLTSLIDCHVSNSIILLASLLLAVGTASAEPVMTVDETRQKQNADFSQSSLDSEKNDAQTQIERAADHFDAFALQMPVFNAKFDAFMKNSFRAILMDNADTKQAEEKMTDSLVKGLKALKNSLSEDLFQPNARSQEEHSV